jgi:tRNA dimethylallyltransferase
MRISERLGKRFDSGMIDEVKHLIDSGISEENLIWYGLEYKYIAMYINNEIDFDEMFRILNTAIHQFSKRQMTWIRKMERNGFEINWIEGELSNEEKLKKIIESI